MKAKALTVPAIFSFCMGLGYLSNAAILELEEFNTGAAGWTDRDAGEMTVSYNGGFGNPAGSMQGTFGGGVLTPETDAFRLTSGPFMGDLTQGGDYDPTAFIFDFYSSTILPSDLIIIIGDGVNTFFRGLTSFVPPVGNWGSISASLAYAGWFGGSQMAFEDTLQNIAFIELQLSRNSDIEQSYYFDNFSYHGNETGGGDLGGDTSAVPEPSTINLLILVGIVTIALRRCRLSPA